VDILLGNLEDAVPVDRKEAARDGLVRVGKEMELGETQLDPGQQPRVPLGAR
jgi:malyl-CoA/(S)-citramalyl-CoA lyase